MTKTASNNRLVTVLLYVCKHTHVKGQTKKESVEQDGEVSHIVLRKANKPLQRFATVEYTQQITQKQNY